MSDRLQTEHIIREVKVQIETHARGMWRYRWRALWLVWGMCIIGWAVVYSLPNVYEARARVYVDTENTIKPLLEGIAISSNVLNEVIIVTREMLSRPNLARVARETDLDIRATTEQEFESLIAALRERIVIDGGPQNIFSISYHDMDRQTAIAVVDSLVNIMVEKSLGADRSEITRAQIFFEEQIKEYEERLTAAEDRLATFKRENIALMPDQRGDYFARLKLSEQALETVRKELLLAEERRTELLRQLEGEEPVFGLAPSPFEDAGATGSASAQIAELERQLESLRLRYTDKHPRIGQILETIEMLKQQQAEEAAQQQTASDIPPSSVNPLDLNPVYQNMKIQLSNTEVDIAALKVEFSRQEREVTQLRQRIDSIPQVEAELNRLNRDYDVIKTRYEQLLLKLETANIGDDVDRSMDDVVFRIIEPSFANLTPTGPIRPLFLTAALLASLAAGFGLAFVLNQLHPVFYDRKTISEVVGIPVLGVVNFVPNESELKAWISDRRWLAALACALIVSFVLVTVFADSGSALVRALVDGAV